MNEVRRVLRLASWRLWLLDVFRTLLITVTVALVLVLLARIVEQVLGLKAKFDPWWRTGFISAGSAAVGVAVLWSIIRRRKAISVAVELDERAGLRESL